MKATTLNQFTMCHNNEGTMFILNKKVYTLISVSYDYFQDGTSIRFYVVRESGKVGYKVLEANKVGDKEIVIVA